MDWSKSDTHYILSFKDDGVGIPEEIQEKIFDFGYSHTDGSGIGLFQVRDTLSKIKSEIVVNTEFKNGVEFLIKIQNTISEESIPTNNN